MRYPIFRNKQEIFPTMFHHSFNIIIWLIDLLKSDAHFQHPPLLNSAESELKTSLVGFSFQNSSVYLRGILKLWTNGNLITTYGKQVMSVLALRRAARVTFNLIQFEYTVFIVQM